MELIYNTERRADLRYGKDLFTKQKNGFIYDIARGAYLRHSKRGLFTA